MKAAVLDFFRVWGPAIMATSAFVTAASAFVALIAAIRHWRDDDPHLAFFVNKKSPNDGTYRYWYVVRIVNAGRHPVHFIGFRVMNGYPTAVNLGTYSYPADNKRLIAPGEMITVDAIVVTEYDDVTFPESAEIWCETSAKKLIYVARVEFTDDCPAAEAKKLAAVAKYDIHLPDGLRIAKGYK